MTSSTSSKAQQHLISEMYLQHHDWLLQWLRHRIKHPLNAADIVQDTFLRLLQAQQKITALQEPRAYLLNIAKHLLIDQHRRYTIEKNYMEALCEQLQLDEQDSQQSRFEDVIQILDFLTVALSTTHSTARQSFLMYYFEGYTQTEIAENLQLSLRTIQGYLADCLSLCYETRHRLNAELNDE
ncbi:sigma-70 family RNA polymerase sigma factor [Acinetobacter qingfengensis]|uniref:RNA polymerase subunit sigma n=1 Tax=Acinetobacter qingfengensis TaxID=1262585 RepID=A0A1E7RAZ5_9GAMM|nr:sigma-70 family RNA polymerase sigma factor [Acinetobacter qingfengensis]KAA8730829.1 sigma-70 family RNA polymerase sigma factor [Acinetobacter qingfengensis]OEY96387.1 RNA polymerase subunit sigma [Acinetobacter qingfengensis]